MENLTNWTQVFYNGWNVESSCEWNHEDEYAFTISNLFGVRNKKANDEE